MTGVLVELAGPAGAGKTTLARELVAIAPRTTLAALPDRRHVVRGIAPAVPSLAAARISSSGRWWTREELRALAYLTAWPAEVARAAESGDLLFDHGPAFRLARLVAGGAPMSTSRSFERLWHRLACDWSALLGVVVWLDAPDSVLLALVRARARTHRLVGLELAEAEAFLDGYRASYARTLGVLAAKGVRVLRFDTSRCTEQQLARQVAGALGEPCLS